jgi:S-adenosylmethionine synthetase
MSVSITSFDPASAPGLEIVERKGIGHPDTLCDALAERFSAALCRFYLERFGTILHHNVDKALLRGGAARAVFGGGEVTEPIDVYLAGRAVTNVGGVTVPLEELARSSAEEWLRAHVRHLDLARHVRIHCLVRQGSTDLRALFARQKAGAMPLSNDTSFGVGYAPLSPLEQVVLDVERDLDSPEFLAAHPAHGEDVKVMATQCGAAAELTVARAFVAAHVPSLDAYLAEKRELAAHVTALAARRGVTANVRVNAADAPDGSAVYLTVTGTSAESGDDGQVGRGNRANGLITPLRPMSLEAVAGKNPVSHVGKLYSLAARAVADRVVAEVGGVSAAECYLVSRIGAPIDQPSVAHVRVATGGAPLEAFRAPVSEIVRAELAALPTLFRKIVDGTVQIF